MRNKQEIKKIIIFILLLLAGVIAYFFIFYQKSPGTYEAKTTLLDPHIIERINYQDKDSKTGKMIHLMFDRTEVSFFDTEKNAIQKFTLTPDLYSQFYTLMASDQSIHFITDEILNPFILSNSLKIITYMMRADVPDASQDKNILQNIQVLENGYYRIQLPGKVESGGWAYFYHPHLYQKMMQAINQS